ncbi:MAG TPA: hypothetical protein VKC17_08040 [Sphingomicrobium sp.]|nr:hypothetical protein [Sphingomicrobium sp.]
MYNFLTNLGRADLLKRQLPGFLTAIVIAEMFYKFHSFMLECVAFLATWFIIDAVIGLIIPNKDEAGRKRV